MVAEARADARIAQDLADRVVYAETDTWCDMDHIDAVRSWASLESSPAGPYRSDAEETPFTLWTRIKLLAREQNVRPLGFLDGAPGGIDSAQTRKAILLHEKLTRERTAPVLILVRDMDNQPERRDGMQQARDRHASAGFDVVIGAANPKREAWVLNGFDPENEAEEAALRAVRQEIGVDARRKAHTLTASRIGDKKSAKRVLDVLIDAPDREARCWQATDLETLAERGEETGLADFLDELRTLVPHFDPTSAPPS